MAAHGATRIVPWWSFTKTILAAAALVLVRDGLGALDEPLTVRRYTLRHLLQHRSGLTDYGGYPAYHEAVERGDDPWAVPALLETVEADRLRYEPGEGWGYSNVGYLFVRQWIEARTGESLHAALGRLVLKPLGITVAHIALEPVDLQGVDMGGAQGYHPGWVYHGLIVGPVAEAALLLARLMAGHLLPDGLLKEILKSYALPGPVPGRPWAAPGYGLGVMVGETSASVKVAGHSGGGPGSTIAVYHAMSGGLRRTAASFVASEDLAHTEEKTLELL